MEDVTSGIPPNRFERALTSRRCEPRMSLVGTLERRKDASLYCTGRRRK